jgi:large subunit ribosomal protein L25
MPEINLAAERRTDVGSAGSRRLRVTGRVPAVVYGRGVEPIAVSVNERDLRAALSTDAGTNALIDLRIGSDRHLALARELQRHPVRQNLSHVDFVVVRRDEVVAADVPIVLTGDALAVHRGGGTVEQLLFTLRVHAKPADIPHAIEFDVSELEIGDTIRLGAAVIPAAVTVDVDEDTPIVAGHAARVEVEPEEEAAEGEVPAEGEGAPAGEAEAGAAEASTDDSSGS